MKTSFGFKCFLIISVLIISLSMRISAGEGDDGIYGASSQAESLRAESVSARRIIGIVTASIRLNVRNGPWGKIIDGFAPGTNVEIVSREGDWYKIMYGDEFAYVHVSLISVDVRVPDKTPVFNPTDSQPVPGVVTASVMLNVRAGPWGKIIDGFAPGAKVDIIGRSGDWYVIKYKSGNAYVHTSLIRTSGTIVDYNTAEPAITDSPQIIADSHSTQASTDVTTLNFNTRDFPGAYDASNDKTDIYNIPAIVKDIPGMWAEYGGLFKKIAAEFGTDPYALAAYCIFESYNCNTHTFNPRMRDQYKTMYAAGIAATQAQDVKNSKIPGLNEKFPPTTEETADLLRSNPEYGLRVLASFFREVYGRTGDLAKTFPKVAYPAWSNPGKSMGAYGTQAQYVSRAYVFYKAFRLADE